MLWIAIWLGGAYGIYALAKECKLPGLLFAIPACVIANGLAPTMSVLGACIVVYGATFAIIAVIAALRDKIQKPGSQKTASKEENSHRE